MPKAKEASIQQSNPNSLVIILIILAFFTGYLFFKVQNLEKGKTANTNGAEVTTAPEQQAPPLNLKDIPKGSNKDHVKGNLNAEIILIEYSDYECPFCKNFHSTMQDVVKAYGNKVAWIFRHYPLSFHTKAQKAAEASECVAELGGNDGFWDFTDLVFERMPDLELTQLPDLVTELGYDSTKFQTCLDSGKYTKKVNDMLAEGTKGGIQGTPGTVIITKSGKRDLIGGALPLDQVKTQIDALLK